MSRSVYPLLFCLCALPMAVHSADGPQETYLIAKDKLQCLYGQIDSLLKEPANPVIVLLNSQCSRLPAQLDIVERGKLPVLNPKVGADATLKPEDVLVLTHAQLQCFKLAFAGLMQQSKEPVPVRFTDTCPTQGSDND